jgi:hypothetical protein
MRVRKTMNKVHTGGTLSRGFDSICGLRYGDSLSKLLFYLTWEKIIHNITVNPRGSKLNRTWQYGAHANDVIIGRSTLVMNEVLQEMETLANDITQKFAT